MGLYEVEIVIENKALARDPEGETICRDLIHKRGYEMVESVRVGKILKVNISAQDEEEARKNVFKMCNDLRIYNPVIHACTIEVKGART